MADKGVCTWVDCEATAHFEQKGAQGDVWACLCETHDKELASSLESGKAQRILGTWVKAQGGPKAAARRMR